MNIFEIWLYLSIIISVIIGVVYLVNTKNQEREEDEKRKAKFKAEIAAKEKYDKIRSMIHVPKSCHKVKCKKGIIPIFKGDNYIWIENNEVCFFPCNPPEDVSIDKMEKVRLFKIPVKNIEYFVQQGEIYHENKITGGGGGGSSVGGAIVGGIIAGEVGAVIGSRKEVNPVKSELLTHDTRETQFNFFVNEVKYSIMFQNKDYDIFNKLIPEKSYAMVNEIKKSNIINKIKSENNASNITNQIREIARLKDEGIITVEEFEEKKKNLLNKI